MARRWQSNFAPILNSAQIYRVGTVIKPYLEVLRATDRPEARLRQRPIEHIAASVQQRPIGKFYSNTKRSTTMCSDLQD